MTNSLKVFSNDDFTIRTINEDGKVWFVARDVAEALDYNLDGGMSRIFGNIPDMWKGGKRIATTSDKPTARPYQEMLCLTDLALGAYQNLAAQIMNALRSFITTRLSRGLGRTQNFLINLRRYLSCVCSISGLNLGF